MIIYTAYSAGKALENVKKRGMGILASPGNSCSRNWKGIPFAIDNGAFSYWQRGYPFLPDRFMKHIESAFKNGLKPNFIVAPDLVAQGWKSLEFSMKWAEKLNGATLALAVQDGMNPEEFTSVIPDTFDFIFIGGTVEWKWATAKSWIDYAHANGMKCHIGRCGRLGMLKTARDLGADSVDSSSFTRNKSFKIVDELNLSNSENEQLDLFRSNDDGSEEE